MVELFCSLCICEYVEILGPEKLKFVTFGEHNSNSYKILESMEL